MKAVSKMTGLSRVSIWRRERDGKFPKRVRLGSNSVGWLEAEILDWLQELSEARYPADKYLGILLDAQPAQSEEFQMNIQKKISTLKAAHKYIKKSWAPIPVPGGKKAPRIKAWTELRLTEKELEGGFPEGSNIGVLLGEPSGGLIDIDIDSDEAVAFAEAFLPKTKAIFGRKSRPGTHRLYRCLKIPKKSIKIIDESKATIVEIRSTGAQTIFPPSTHPSGEDISWENAGTPAEVDSDALILSVRLVAAGTILAHHYPAQGSRHDYSLVIASLLARAGYEEDIKHFLHTVAYQAGDEEVDDRINSADSALSRIADGNTTWGLPHLADLIGDDPTQAVAKILGLDFKKSGKQSQRERLDREVAPLLDTWHTSDGTAFASFDVNGHRENHRVRSKQFRYWVIRKAMEKSESVGKAAIDDVVSFVEARAIVGPERAAEMRVAEHEGNIYIDLADQNWRAIRISPEGWEVVSTPPVRFYRSGGMEPLPEPRPGGKLEELRPFVNVSCDDDFLLLQGIVIGAFIPWGAHAVAVFNGEQGSAKSTVVRVIRALIDPSKAPTRAEPSSEEDMYVAAANSYLLSFDNISYLTAKMSDALCRIATGGGFSKRQLFTDQDEIILQVCRPILLNGIPNIVYRPDLMDRSIVLTLPQITSDKRQTERELLEQFEKTRPLILGAICDALSAGLRCRADVRLNELPRMADLIVFMTAVERGMEWKEGSFTEAYSENNRTSMMDLAAADPLVEAIRKILDGGPFKGTASELLTRIRARLPEHERQQKGIPHRPNSLSGHLRRLAPALRELGIEVTLEAGRDEENRKLIEIEYLEEPSF